MSQISQIKKKMLMLFKDQILLYFFVIYRGLFDDIYYFGRLEYVFDDSYKIFDSVEELVKC